MKIGMFFSVMFAVFFLSVICVKAETIYSVHSIHVEWGYTPPCEPAVLGFKLHKEGVPVITWDGAHTSEGNATLLLPDNEVTPFTLTAVFADGTESPHSSIFWYDPNKAKPPTPQILELIVSMLGKNLKPEMKIRCGVLDMS